MAKKNYVVDYESKKIKADIEKLTADEMEEIKKFMFFGFEMDTSNKAKEQKEQAENKKTEESKTTVYTAKNMQAFLTKYSAEKEKDKADEEKAINKYWKIHNDYSVNELTGKYNVYEKDIIDKKETKKQKTPVYKHKAGDKKIKGHVATINWFKGAFVDVEEEQPKNEWNKWNEEQEKKKAKNK